MDAEWGMDRNSCPELSATASGLRMDNQWLTPSEPAALFSNKYLISKPFLFSSLGKMSSHFKTQCKCQIYGNISLQALNPDLLTQPISGSYLTYSPFTEMISLGLALPHNMGAFGIQSKLLQILFAQWTPGTGINSINIY